MAAPPTIFPFTLREALYGNDTLEACVSSVTHVWPDAVHRRLLLFSPILDRPKQALQHLLELFILHVCQMETPSDPLWLTNLIQYLAHASVHLIPDAKPVRATQWVAAVCERGGKTVSTVPQMEESYPRNLPVDSKLIINILSSYASSFTEPDISKLEIASMTGLMDEPAKTAVIVYAWFLASLDIRNGWLRKMLNSDLGRRERPRTAPPSQKPRGGGRLGRLSEEPHTIFSNPFINRIGHLVWYTVRQAIRGEIIGGPACSYARGNNVRMQCSKDLAKSVRIHHSQICNLERLDFRLWESWSHSVRASGPYASLGCHALSARRVKFDEPVRLEDALAVGFRVVDDTLVSPNGKELVVSRRKDGFYSARSPILLSTEVGPVKWRAGMLFT